MPKKLQYNSRVVRDIQLGKSKHVTVTINKRNKETINKQDIEKLLKELQESTAHKDKDVKFAIVGSNALSTHWNIKSFDGELKVLEEDEYLDGEVKETNKFAWFSQISITAAVDV